MSFTTYHLIGAGGTGSILAPQLLRQLHKAHGYDFRLNIVDADYIEEKNLERQGYLITDIGKGKAEALVSQLGDPNVKAINAFIDPDWLRTNILDTDVVLVAVDNFMARADIEARALELANITVINGGNEATTASCQIFMRRQGKNLTPPLSYQHPEILTPGLRAAEESCLVRAAEPSDAQTVAANMLSAGWMLAAVYHIQSVELHREIAQITGIADDDYEELSPLWHELHADINKGKAGGPDWRQIDKSESWRTYQPERKEAAIA